MYDAMSTHGRDWRPEPLPGHREPSTEAETDIAQAMAEMAALTQERSLRERNLLAEQLQVALNSRVVIAQAKGMPAEYLTMSVDDAFSLLSNYTPGNNRRLSEVASRRISRAELARWPSR